MHREFHSNTTLYIGSVEEPCEPSLVQHPHSIDFDMFLESYFFSTAFLMDPERFNNMDSEEKKSLKLTDPCLFGVINHLIPSEEETKLQTITETPYSK